MDWTKEALTSAREEARRVFNAYLQPLETLSSSCEARRGSGRSPSQWATK